MRHASSLVGWSLRCSGRWRADARGAIADRVRRCRTRSLPAQASTWRRRPRQRAPGVRAAPARRRASRRTRTASTPGRSGSPPGALEGAPLQFAAELARVLDDGDNMRVLPIVTRGPFDNVYDLLYLRGVDAAIVYGDVLDHFKTKPEFANAWRRINYLREPLPLGGARLRQARDQLAQGPRRQGRELQYARAPRQPISGPIIFKQLGIEVKATFMPHNVAMEKMKAGPEVAATFWISSKPLAPFLKGKFPEGFKFLPIEYTDKLEYYAPAYLEHTDYPALIPQGTQIATISVPAVLAVYDWPRSTDRYQRLERVVDYLFERFEKLQKEPGYHEKWKDVNLAASVPGWKRFKPLQDKLDKAAAASARSVDPAQLRAQAARAAPHDPAEQERLFQQFLEWNRKQSKQ